MRAGNVTLGFCGDDGFHGVWWNSHAQSPLRVMRRAVAPAAAALLLALFTALHECDRPLYFAVLDAIGEHPFRFPFLDTRFVTAQVQCWHAGIDVYAANPCDPLGRTQDYSPLWLRLPFLALGPGWTPVLGLGLALLFVGSLLLLPLDLSGAFGSFVTLASVLSLSTIFAIERGNTDLLMFAAAALFAHLLTRGAALRSVGYALVLGVGLLKFYPLAMLAVAVREPPRRFWPIAGIAAAAVGLFAVALHAELARIGANMAAGFFGGMFGARSLPFGLLTLWRLPQPLPAGSAPASLLLAGMTAACLLVAVRRGRDRALRAALDRLGAAERSSLLVGSVLCAGCFFCHQNIDYRAMLLLLVVPGLLGLVRATADRDARSVFRITAVLVVLVLWADAIGGTFAGWFAVQLAWWWIVAILLSIAWCLLEQDALARLVPPTFFPTAARSTTAPDSPASPSRTAWSSRACAVRAGRCRSPHSPRSPS